MQDILTRVATLKRPRLLARAARIGAQDYRRAVHLPRLTKQSPLPRHAEALVRLSDLEAEMNMRRVSGDSTYSLPRHVDLLSALVAEAALLRASSDRLRSV